MKKIIVFVALFLMFSVTMFNSSAYAGDYSTDFTKAFKVGDSESKSSTFKFIGVERTLSVRELKEHLKQLGYGTYFAADQPTAGYTQNVDRAFRSYAEAYEQKLKAAEEELNRNPIAN